MNPTLSAVIVAAFAFLSADALGQTGPPQFSSTQYTVGPHPVFVALGDLTGDDNLDVLVANEDYGGNGQVSVLLNAGQGYFGSATNFGAGNPQSIAIGDLNGDGNLDMAIANIGTKGFGSLLVRLGNGHGGFGNAMSFNVGPHPSSVAIADLNGDGKLDLAATTSGGIAVLLGDGQGGFASATSFGVGSVPFGVAIGDLNSDGKPDLVVTNNSSGTISVLLNQGTSSPYFEFCYGDSSVVHACPCGNNGLPGHGCENSVTTGGASLSAVGTASLSADTVQLTASAELPTALSIVLQGTSVLAPTNFGDGLRCAGGALERLYVKHASGGTMTAPQAGDPSISARSAALGGPIPMGGTRAYQVYYRDPNFTFCSGGFNVSSAISIVWGS